MNEWLLIVAFVVGGIGAGYLLNAKGHETSRALESAWRIPFNAIWLLAGIYMIVGGYYAAGIILLVLASYFFFANTRRVRESDIDVRSGGWRRKAANWRPYDRSR